MVAASVAPWGDEKAQRSLSEALGQPPAAPTLSDETRSTLASMISVEYED